MTDDPAAREQTLCCLDDYIRTAKVLHARVPANIGGGGHPDKLMLILEGGVTVLAKLGGDDVAVADARREIAAAVIARTLGWGDLLAATVKREVPRPDGSGERVEAALVVWWEDSEWLHEGPYPEDQQIRAAIFDALIAHQDRGRNNWFGSPSTSERRLVLIDHGRALGRDGSWSINSWWFERYNGAEIPREYRDDLRRFVDRPAHDTLTEYVGSDITARLVERARILADTGRIEAP